MLQFITIESTGTGFLLDPSAYLAKLPEIAAALPPGARRFASDPAHYDFHDEHCVKDLKVHRLAVTHPPEGLAVELVLRWNEVSDEILTLSYRQVSQLRLDGEAGRLGPVQLDETLPVPGGCTHTIQLIAGVVAVTCADFEAVWGRLG
ncbi:hypothetical protein GCM10009760_07360 [Kitasatospora kazusensis]|uniref:Immunity protein 50 of polymorphic toxin system n=1 Tax=Kitasatospora kazusensis TaxID=407974 RepID=A0ABN2YUE8_9ACTN